MTPLTVNQSTAAWHQFVELEPLKNCTSTQGSWWVTAGPSDPILTIDIPWRPQPIVDSCNCWPPLLKGCKGIGILCPLYSTSLSAGSGEWELCVGACCRAEGSFRADSRELFFCICLGLFLPAECAFKTVQRNPCRDCNRSNRCASQATHLASTSGQLHAIDLVHSRACMQALPVQLRIHCFSALSVKRLSNLLRTCHLARAEAALWARQGMRSCPARLRELVLAIECPCVLLAGCAGCVWRSCLATHIHGLCLLGLIHPSI